MNEIAEIPRWLVVFFIVGSTGGIFSLIALIFGHKHKRKDIEEEE